MIKITSDVDQTVYISAYTYDAQHIRNGGCGESSYDSYIRFSNNKTSEVLRPHLGYNHFEPL